MRGMSEGVIHNFVLVVLFSDGTIERRPFHAESHVEARLEGSRMLRDATRTLGRGVKHAEVLSL